MSARDDYPGLAASVDAWFTICAVSNTEARRALDEIDALRADCLAARDDTERARADNLRLRQLIAEFGHVLVVQGRGDES